MNVWFGPGFLMTVENVRTFLRVEMASLLTFSLCVVVSNCECMFVYVCVCSYECV